MRSGRPSMAGWQHSRSPSLRFLQHILCILERAQEAIAVDEELTSIGHGQALECRVVTGSGRRQEGRIDVRFPHIVSHHRQAFACR